RSFRMTLARAAARAGVIAAWTLIARVAAAAPATGVRIEAAALRVAHEHLRFTSTATRRSLAHPFVAVGTDSVRCGDSLLVRHRDYGIDTSRGIVFLLAPPDSVRDLDVTYHYLPAPFRQRYRAFDILPRDAALRASPGASLPRPAPSGGVAAGD